MSEVLERWRRVAGTFSERTDGVPPDAWESPAPCEGWTARDVIRHLTEWIPPFLASGASLQIAEGPSVEEDPAGAWGHLAGAIDGLLTSADVHKAEFDHPRAGRFTLDEAIERFIVGDVLIHTWDLARATGQDERLDPELVASMVEAMEPMADMLAESGQYGPRTPVAPDADEQTRLIALSGRTP